MDDEMVCSLQRCRVNTRKDGDLLFTTNNRVLVDNLRDLPALMCFQRKAKKVIPTEEILIQANIDSFGDDIGKVTNRITAMYDVQAKYNKDSIEYKTLEYRIMSGQQLQQNAIDKAKGIVAKPMPKTWYDYNVNKNDIRIPEEQAELNMRILADKKPYFMIYIYPSLKMDYKDFEKNARNNSLRRFGVKLEYILNSSEENLTSEMIKYKEDYYKYSPVGMNNCIINKICWFIEDEFDEYTKFVKSSDDIDRSIIKRGIEYSESQKRLINEVYNEYKKRASDFKVKAYSERITKSEYMSGKEDLRNDFVALCERAVPNKYQLCDIIVDLCYTKESTKGIAWTVSADTMIENLLNKNDNIIRFPTYDTNGDVLFSGKLYTFKTKTIGGNVEF